MEQNQLTRDLYAAGYTREDHPSFVYYCLMCVYARLGLTVTTVRAMRKRVDRYIKLFIDK